MDNSEIQSQGSISSISTTNQILDVNGVTGSITSPEFVNHETGFLQSDSKIVYTELPLTTLSNAGLILWNQTRQKWIGNKKFEKRPQEVCEPKLKYTGGFYEFQNLDWPDFFILFDSWNACLDGSNKPFSRPISLSKAVDFQVGLWKRWGLYD